MTQSVLFAEVRRRKPLTYFLIDQRHGPYGGNPSPGFKPWELFLLIQDNISCSKQLAQMVESSILDGSAGGWPYPGLFGSTEIEMSS